MKTKVIDTKKKKNDVLKNFLTDCLAAGITRLSDLYCLMRLAKLGRPALSIREAAGRPSEGYRGGHDVNATNMIDRLDRLGLIYRTPGEADRRKIEIRLTSVGRELMRRKGASDE